MEDHGFIEEGNMLSAQDIINRKDAAATFITVEASHTLREVVQLMRKNYITQIPVMEGNKVIGSITESRVLNTILDDPALKDEPVSFAMNDPFPFVLPTTRIDVLSKMINKENPAVLVQLEEGTLGIITEYDLISILAG